MGFARIETLVDEAAAARPDHPALICGERCWTYAQLREEMDRRAAVLVEAGFEPGDIILTTETVTDDVALVFLACCRAGLILLYLSPKLTVAELTPLVVRAQPACVLTCDSQPHPAAPLIASLPLSLPGRPSIAAMREAQRRSDGGTVDDPAIIQATSGTTGGIPKLACLPHRLLTWLRATPTWWETADQVAYMPRPHAIAARLMCVVLGLGATMILSDAVDPDRLESEMAAYGVTALWTVPSLLQLLVVYNHPPPAMLRLAFVRTAAAPLLPDLLWGATRRYNAAVVQEYGSIEGGSMMGTPHGTPAGSIGQPYPGVAARIVDNDGRDVSAGAIGELLIRAPARMLGYVGDREATAHAYHDGWLRTGDLARRDANGFYFLEGRRRLRINVGGLKVTPEEVERVLALHPGVREAVVLAMPDAVRGEAVRAVIVPCGDPPANADLRHFCRAHLAGYKIPRRWEFRTDLPRSPLGKVLRHKL
jgi:acyl-coenzyme A synthetase/AMP-(fatty) acid ligase